ncbi:hypothetical protein GCM10010472_24410 [Pseudonocardia halophobica]|uniref:50S ribosomal protein L22 n=1 Tax=Pseudonocardia halophobica TaxID=29401 RepID=A0A9W6NUD8_9PSEU|nr:iron-sulfur cluster assembly protein [Pseudonocardia halophobica]GLL09674.1 hypothetical protein GCM10017577_08140 [Pseudonocardia halophobica]
MTALAELTDITVREPQVRLTEAEATKALDRVLGTPAVEARARLRFGAGTVCEPLARMLDAALVRAQECGLDPEALVLAAARAVSAEDIVRVRRKAHGVADWISSKTSDVTIVLRPRGLTAPAPSIEAPEAPPVQEYRAETEAELAVREVLYDVVDPDLGVNVVDLGFVRRIRLDEAGHATIVMTLTSAACPLTGVMESQMKTFLSEEGIEFTVEWEWLPTWRPADITDDGREQLRAIGFSNF